MEATKNYKVKKAKGKSALSKEDDTIYIVSKQYDVDTGEELPEDKIPCPSPAGIDFELKKRNQENKDLESSKSDIGWGHQIRSYVLQPYQLVKDLRNKIEHTNPKDVLDGNIDKFIEAGIINK